MTLGCIVGLVSFNSERDRERENHCEKALRCGCFCLSLAESAAPAAGRPGRSRRRPAPSARSHRRSRRSSPKQPQGRRQQGHKTRHTLHALGAPWSLESACRSSRSPPCEETDRRGRARAPPSSRPHSTAEHSRAEVRRIFPESPLPLLADGLSGARRPGPGERKGGQTERSERSKEHTKVWTGSGSSRPCTCNQCNHTQITQTALFGKTLLWG